MKLWRVSRVNQAVVVYPLEDSGGHNLIGVCGCHPRIEQTNGLPVIIHNSFDGRERVEEIEDGMAKAN